MRTLRILAVTLMVVCALGSNAYAQSDENRVKIQMTITTAGKSITTELGSLSSSLARSFDTPAAASTVTEGGAKKADAVRKESSLYLSMEIKRITDDLLRIFGKKESQFDGVITVVDTYGKYPTRTYKFSKARLTSYSEQASTVSYGEGFSAAFISINCESASINGIEVD